MATLETTARISVETLAARLLKVCSWTVNGEAIEYKYNRNPTLRGSYKDRGKSGEFFW